MGDNPNQNLDNIVRIACPILLAIVIIGVVLIIASLGWKKQTGSKKPGESGGLNDKADDEL